MFFQSMTKKSVWLVTLLAVSGVLCVSPWAQPLADSSGITPETVPPVEKACAPAAPKAVDKNGCEISINFDDITAVCSFAETTRLTDTYADLGVTFSGPSGNNGGAILNECSLFAVTGYSSPNFLAFNTSSSMSDGGIPQGPETVTFDTPIVSFEAGFASSHVSDVTLTAYNADNDVVDTVTAALTSAMQRLRVFGLNITRVEFNATASDWVADDICIMQTKTGSGALVLLETCTNVSTSSNFASPALTNLGYAGNLTVVSLQAEFEYAIKTGDWSIIIMDNYMNSPTETIMDALFSFYGEGGKVIFFSYAMDSFNSHNFFTDPGVTVGSAYTDPIPIYAWAHDPLFLTPNDVPDLSSFLNICGLDGYFLDVSDAIAVAGYTTTEEVGQAAIVMSSDGQIIVNGFAPGIVAQDADSDGKNDMIELYENEIFSLVGFGDGILFVDPANVDFRMTTNSEDSETITVTNASAYPVDWSAGFLKVLIVLASIPGRFFDELNDQPGIGVVDYFDARSAAPTVGEMASYDVVIVSSDFPLNNTDALGDALADYVDGGGKVIHNPFCTTTGFNIGGRFLSEGYMAFNLGPAHDFGNHNLGVFDAAHPIMDGITTLFGHYVVTDSLAAGASLVATWDDNYPFVATQGDSVVGINLFVGGYNAIYSGDVPRLFRNAILWLVDEPWLSISPDMGTLLPGESSAITLNANSQGKPVGYYDFEMLHVTGIDGGDQSIPVSLGVIDPCANDAEFSQRVGLDFDSGSANTSSDSSTYIVYENFQGLTGNISRLQWWGLDLAYSGGWSECDRPSPDQFQITFYPDDAGVPGAATTALTVEATDDNTGVTVGGFTLKRYNVTFPIPLAVDAGWVSIQGIDSDSCWFLWATSPEGDFSGLQDSGSGPTAIGQNFALCITTCPQTYAPGARVVSTVDNPGGIACIVEGTLGTVICEDTSGDADWLVRWDGITCGHQGNYAGGGCGIVQDGKGWYVTESQIDATCGDCPDSGSDFFTPGDRVVALVDNPEGNSCIMAGTHGTLICYNLFSPHWLVEWDGISCGHDGNGFCGVTADGHGWYVNECTISLLPADQDEGEGTGEGEGEGAVEGTAEGAEEGEGAPEGDGEGSGVLEGEESIHSADPNGDGIITLSELLRVIQFFNSNGLHCETGTEDGYAPGPGNTSCTPHDSDYNAQDWLINLSELLRIIQFFNSGGYHACSGSEDGFCPGL